MKVKGKCTKLKNLQSWQEAWLRTNYKSRLVVHEALACPACPWFITTLPRVVEIVDVATAHRCSGLAAEGELDWLSG